MPNDSVKLHSPEAINTHTQKYGKLGELVWKIELINIYIYIFFLSGSYVTLRIIKNE